MNSRTSWRLFVCALLAIVSISAVQAQEPLQVGDHFPIRVQSNGPSDLEGRDSASGTTYTLHHPGATYISLHFSQFDLSPGDYLTISDASGDQSYELTRLGKRQMGTFWARHIKGDTAVVELVRQSSTSSNDDSGFSVDEYVAGFIDLGTGGSGGSAGGQTEAICGADDKRNAVCFESSHPVEYDKSRAVARLLIQGSSLCTGWLASAQNHFVTNEHCISSATAAANTDYEFMAEAASCGTSNCQLCHPGVVFDGATFIQDNPSLDYALVQFTASNPAATYGYLEIDDRAAQIGEEIYIPQHPGGRAKELGIESSASADGGLCHVNTFSAGCSSGAYSDVGYQCDTEGGSSGSPVLASSSHKVIALHHCANCPNRGVPITLVCDEICPLFGPECTTNGDCNSGGACTTGSCVNEECVYDPVADCCGNGSCESGEDCDSCASDCPSGAATAVCGNGVCETADGEDCSSCAADCAGQQSGRPANRFCCGADVDCNDSRCSSGGNVCSSVPGTGECCGDGNCEGGETGASCAIDCASSCTVDADCADADVCTTDSCIAGICMNIDQDCDDNNACTVDDCSGGNCSSTPISCDDGDACTTDSCSTASGCVHTSPTCGAADGCCPSGCAWFNDGDCATCANGGGACSTNSDCCSNKCKGNGICR
jgi:hypothetical protein